MTTTNNTLARVAAVVAGVALVAMSFASFAPAQAAFTRDLTIGSTGADVTELQNWLISEGQSIPAGATGYFGAQTQAALAAWQAANGVTPPAGYFGPITRAAVMADGGGSGSGSGSGNAGLEGGAGSLDDADFVSSLNNEEVGEDQEEAPVMGLDLESDDGSDLLVTSVKVSFEEQGAGGSDDLDDYADSVQVMFEGEVVGSADVDDFNENSGEYSKTIALDEDAVVPMDDEAELVIAVTAVSNIDSSDLGSGNNDWEVWVDSVRYEDADGAVITDTSTGDIGSSRSFFFDSFASANDVELTVSKNSDTPDEQVVTVDEDGGDEVELLIADFEAEGSDIEVSEITLVVTTDGTAGDAAAIATSYKLMVDGDEIDSLDGTDCDAGDCSGDASGPSSATYVFGDFDEFTIDDGDTLEITVVAELDEIDGANFYEGDSLDASIAASTVEADDQSGEQLTGGELNGTANGEEQTFFSEGIMVDEIETSKSVTFTADDAGEESIGKFEVTFEVTANDTDVYLDKSTDGSGAFGTNGEGVVYFVDSTATPDAVSATFECVSSCGNNADNTVDEFFIEEGDTETYRLTVTVTGDSTPTSADFAVWIESINWDSADVANATQFYSSNLGEDSDADTGSLNLIAL